jgi:hypothetical protein
MDNTIVIYKYKLDIGNDNILPCGDVLLVDNQNENLYIWIQHFKTTPWLSNYTVYGTGITDLGEDITIEGWERHLNKKHVGSAKCGEFVWHVYSKYVK